MPVDSSLVEVAKALVPSLIALLTVRYVGMAVWGQQQRWTKRTEAYTAALTSLSLVVHRIFWVKMVVAKHGDLMTAIKYQEGLNAWSELLLAVHNSTVSTSFCELVGSQKMITYLQEEKGIGIPSISARLTMQDLDALEDVIQRMFKDLLAQSRIDLGTSKS